MLKPALYKGMSFTLWIIRIYMKYYQPRDSLRFLISNCSNFAESSLQKNQKETLLEQLCDLVAPPLLILHTSIRNTNLFGVILEILNIFVLRYSFTKEKLFFITYQFSIFRAFYFSLTWANSTISYSVFSVFPCLMWANSIISYSVFSVFPWDGAR